MLYVSRLRTGTSWKTLEAEFSKLGQIESIRMYSNWAFVKMKSAKDVKSILRNKYFLTQNKRWKIKPACVSWEDPSEHDLYRHAKHQTPKTSASSSFNSNEPAYELSILQLSVNDRKRLYDILASGPAFPCKKDISVKGLTHDQLNKAKKLLKKSRTPNETTHAAPDYLLTLDNRPNPLMQAPPPMT